MRILISSRIGDFLFSIGGRRSRVVKNVIRKQTTQMPAYTIIVRGHPWLSRALLSCRYSVMAGVSVSVSWSRDFVATSGATLNGKVLAGCVAASVIAAN